MILIEFYHQRQNTKDYYSDKNLDNRPFIGLEEKVKTISQEATYKLGLDIASKIKYLKGFLRKRIKELLSLQQQSLMIQLIFAITQDESIVEKVIQSNLVLKDSTTAYDDFLNQIDNTLTRVKLKSLFDYFKNKNIPPNQMIPYMIDTYISKLIDTKWQILLDTNIDESFYPLVFRFVKPVYGMLYSYLRKDLVVLLHSVLTKKSYTQLEINLDMVLQLINNKLELVNKYQSVNESSAKDFRYISYLIQLSCIDALSEFERKSITQPVVNTRLLKRMNFNQLLASNVLFFGFDTVVTVKDDLNIPQIYNDLQDKFDISLVIFLELIAKSVTYIKSPVNVIYHLLRLHDELFATDYTKNYFEENSYLIQKEYIRSPVKQFDLFESSRVNDYFRSQINVFYTDIIKYFVKKIADRLIDMFDYLISIMQDEYNQSILADLKKELVIYYKTMLVGILQKELDRILYNTSLLPECISLIFAGRIEPLFTKYLEVFQQLINTVINNVDDVFERLFTIFETYGTTLENINIYEVGKNYLQQKLNTLWDECYSELFDIVRKRLFDILKKIDFNIDLIAKYASFPPEIVYQLLTTIVALWFIEPVKFNLFGQETLDSFTYNLYIDFIKDNFDDIKEYLLC